MDKDQIRYLLNRLATDDAYRQKIESDPIGTLAEQGIEVTPADIPADGVHLPSKEDISAQLDALVDDLSARGAPPTNIVYIWLRG